MTGLDPGRDRARDPGWRERAAAQGAAYGGVVSDGPVGAAAGVDPLKLCVFTTVALLGWLLGPWAVLVFATLAFTAYLKARRGGLLRSKCLLRDTRLVLAWLGLLVVVAVAAIAWDVAQLLDAAVTTTSGRGPESIRVRLRTAVVRRRVLGASRWARRSESAEVHPLRAASYMGGRGIPEQYGSVARLRRSLGVSSAR